MDYQTRKSFEERRDEIEYVLEMTAIYRQTLNYGQALAVELRALNGMLFSDDNRRETEALARWNSMDIGSLEEEIDMAGDFISEHHMEIDSEPEWGCEACSSANRDIAKIQAVIKARILPIAKCWCGRELKWFPSCGSMCDLGHDPSKERDELDPNDIPF